MLRAALGTPSHAYLFAGPPNVGKLTAALAFAQALNCEQQGCGECTECRSIASGNHPDVRVWLPPEDKKVLPVELARKLVAEAEWKSYRARYKVGILRAETLNLESANTLLKTLEEPREGTVLILLASSVENVLPTLVSRCQTVSFGPVAAGDIAPWLEGRGADPVRAAELARVAGGRPGWAAKRIEGEALPQSRIIDLDDLLERLGEADRMAGLPADEQLVALESLIVRVRDIMIWTQTHRADWVADPEATEARCREGFSMAYWLRILGLLETSRRQLVAHANAKLAWSVLATELVPTPLERK